MNPSVENVFLLAKLRHVEELERLSISIGFVETIGLMIHHLQAERGASSLYLASHGKRFSKERIEIIAHNQQLDVRFSLALEAHLNGADSTDARQLTLISWVLLGIDQIKSFRHQVTLLKITFSDCIQAYTRLINSLVSLIFDITDNSMDSRVSKYLVALYNLVQGKEFAGQERAVGSYAFGSGSISEEHQQRLSGLVELQERHFELFCQFASPELVVDWQRLVGSKTQLKHLAYREKLFAGSAHQALKAHLGDDWFDVCSARLSDIWQLQCQLINLIHAELASLTVQAKADVEQARSTLEEMKHKGAAVALPDSFFNLDIPVEQAFGFLADDKPQAYPIASMFKLLQQQSQQIAEIESELSETRKSLAERKQIERAKGLIMSKLGINEVEAYKWLRSTAMDQNRKLIEVAENIIALSKPASQR